LCPYIKAMIEHSWNNCWNRTNFSLVTERIEQAIVRIVTMSWCKAMHGQRVALLVRVRAIVRPNSRSGHAAYLTDIFLMCFWNTMIIVWIMTFCIIFISYEHVAFWALYIKLIFKNEHQFNTSVFSITRRKQQKSFLWPLWCESVCTLKRRLTLKIWKAFSTSLHLWFCIKIPITIVTGQPNLFQNTGILTIATGLMTTRLDWNLTSFSLMKQL